MTVRPATVNFRLYIGATFSEPAIIKDANGNPINLTGYSAELMARRDISDSLPVLDLKSATGGIVLGTTNGMITLNVSAASTAALTVDWDGEMWVHDLLLTYPDAVTKQRTYQGAIIVVPGVTR